MSFDKKTLEKDLNRFNEEFQDEHMPAPAPPPLPPSLPQQEPAYYPPPVEPQSVFLSYKPPRRIWMPTPLFILFVLVFFFESSVLFVYTIVGLVNMLPPTRMPMSAPNGCDCMPFVDRTSPANNAPIFFTADQAGPRAVTPTIDPVTITITASSSATPTSSMDTVSTSTSPKSVTSAISAVIGSIPQDSASILTVTAPASTLTVISTTTPPSLPSITTQTIISTAEPAAPTVTSIAFVTGS
ncbi:hypothetical protein MBLNU457_4852t1 [Dothideomycetes sp. NU457]